LAVTALHRSRWQVQLFFRWIHQHLRIKAFYGISSNAVRTQIWIVVTVYVLVTTARRRLQIDRKLYTLLEILSVHLLDKMLGTSALGYTLKNAAIRKELSLFNF